MCARQADRIGSMFRVTRCVSTTDAPPSIPTGGRCVRLPRNLDNLDSMCRAVPDFGTTGGHGFCRSSASRQVRRSHVDVEARAWTASAVHFSFGLDRVGPKGTAIDDRDEPDSRPAARIERAGGREDRRRRRGAGDGAGRADVVRLWAGGRADHPAAARGGRAAVHRADHDRHPRPAGDALPLVPPDDRRLPGERRVVHGREGEPRHLAGAAGGGRPHARLRAERRRRHLGRRGGAGVGRARRCTALRCRYASRCWRSSRC